jgi:hypothetical protein
LHALGKVEDLSIHYQIEGNGEPLALLHSMSNNFVMDGINS